MAYAIGAIGQAARGFMGGYLQGKQVQAEKAQQYLMNLDRSMQHQMRIMSDPNQMPSAREAAQTAFEHLNTESSRILSGMAPKAKGSGGDQGSGIIRAIFPFLHKGGGNQTPRADPGTYPAQDAAAAQVPGGVEPQPQEPIQRQPTPPPGGSFIDPAGQPTQEFSGQGALSQIPTTQGTPAPARGVSVSEIPGLASGSPPPSLSSIAPAQANVVPPQAGGEMPPGHGQAALSQTAAIPDAGTLLNDYMRKNSTQHFRPSHEETLMNTRPIAQQHVSALAHTIDRIAFAGLGKDDSPELGATMRNPEFRDAINKLQSYENSGFIKPGYWKELEARMFKNFYPGFVPQLPRDAAKAKYFEISVKPEAQRTPEEKEYLTNYVGGATALGRREDPEKALAMDVAAIIQEKGKEPKNWTDPERRIVQSYDYLQESKRPVIPSFGHFPGETPQGQPAEYVIDNRTGKISLATGVLPKGNIVSRNELGTFKKVYDPVTYAESQVFTFDANMIAGHPRMTPVVARNLLNSVPPDQKPIIQKYLDEHKELKSPYAAPATAPTPASPPRPKW